MTERSITVKRVLKPNVTRKVIKDAMFKITIPMDWASFFNLQKGQAVELELRENGFLVIIRPRVFMREQDDAPETLLPESG